MPRPPSASTRSSRTPRTTRWKWLLILLALGVIPAIVILLVVYWLFGRELKTGYDREYEQEPPSDLAAGARADAAAAGRRGRVVRVHRDALRPDPARRLHLEAGHDGGLDLRRACTRRSSPTSSSRRASPTRPCCRGSRTSRTSSTACSTAAPRTCRSSASGSRASAPRWRRASPRSSRTSRRR